MNYFLSTTAIYVALGFQAIIPALAAEENTVKKSVDHLYHVNRIRKEYDELGRTIQDLADETLGRERDTIYENAYDAAGQALEGAVKGLDAVRAKAKFDAARAEYLETEQALREKRGKSASFAERQSIDALILENKADFVERFGGTNRIAESQSFRAKAQRLRATADQTNGSASYGISTAASRKSPNGQITASIERDQQQKNSNRETKKQNKRKNKAKSFANGQGRDKGFGSASGGEFGGSPTGGGMSSAESAAAAGFGSSPGGEFGGPSTGGGMSSADSAAAAGFGSSPGGEFGGASTGGGMSSADSAAAAGFGAASGGEFGGSGGSDGGGDGRIICGELCRQGYMDIALYKENLRNYFESADPYAAAAYLFWATPYVQLMRQSQLATLLVKPIGLAWSRQMAFETAGMGSASLLGRTVVAVLYPVHKIAGRLFFAKKAAAIRRQQRLYKASRSMRTAMVEHLFTQTHHIQTDVRGGQHAEISL